MSSLKLKFGGVAFLTHKPGELLSDCRDAAAISADGTAIGLADGVTTAFQAGAWAKHLVKAFVEHPPKQEMDCEWIQAAQEEWTKHLERLLKNSIPGEMNRTRIQLREAGVATFVGIQLQDGPEGKTQVRAAIRGDSCLLVVRGGKIACSLPKDKVEQFDNFPDNISSNEAPATIKFSDRILELEDGDTLVLATDSLAKFLIGAQGDELKTCLEIENETQFTEYVTKHRKLASEDLQDDLTLIRLTVAANPEKLDIKEVTIISPDVISSGPRVSVKNTDEVVAVVAPPVVVVTPPKNENQKTPASVAPPQKPRSKPEKPKNPELESLDAQLKAAYADCEAALKKIKKLEDAQGAVDKTNRSGQRRRNTIILLLLLLCGLFSVDQHWQHKRNESSVKNLKDKYAVTDKYRGAAEKCIQAEATFIQAQATFIQAQAHNRKWSDAYKAAFAPYKTALAEYQTAEINYQTALNGQKKNTPGDNEGFLASRNQTSDDITTEPAEIADAPPADELMSNALVQAFRPITNALMAATNVLIAANLRLYAELDQKNPELAATNLAFETTINYTNDFWRSKILNLQQSNSTLTSASQNLKAELERTNAGLVTANAKYETLFASVNASGSKQSTNLQNRVPNPIVQPTTARRGIGNLNFVIVGCGKNFEAAFKTVRQDVMAWLPTYFDSNNPDNKYHYVELGLYYWDRSSENKTSNVLDQFIKLSLNDSEFGTYVKFEGGITFIQDDFDKTFHFEQNGRKDLKDILYVQIRQGTYPTAQP